MVRRRTAAAGRGTFKISEDKVEESEHEIMMILMIRGYITPSPALMYLHCFLQLQKKVIAKKNNHKFLVLFFTSWKSQF